MHYSKHWRLFTWNNFYQSLFNLIWHWLRVINTHRDINSIFFSIFFRQFSLSCLWLPQNLWIHSCTLCYLCYSENTNLECIFHYNFKPIWIRKKIHRLWILFPPQSCWTKSIFLKGSVMVTRKFLIFFCITGKFPPKYAVWKMCCHAFTPLKELNYVDELHNMVTCPPELMFLVL